MRPIHWILSLMLLLAPLTAPAQQTVLVKAQTLTLRSKPSRSASALGNLVSFQPVQLLKKEGDWAQVKTAQNQTGYVLASYLTKHAFVYTDLEKINGRYGPGSQYDVIIEYTQPTLPLRVLDVANENWLMVMDYEGDRSWVFSKNVKTEGNYVITKLENCNVRKGVGIGEDLVFTAKKGVIFKALEEKEGWLHIKHEDGDEGWLSAKLVFGWLEETPPPAKGESPAKETSSSKSDDEKASSKSDSESSKSGSKKTSSKSSRSGSSSKTRKRSTR